jgi:hypothetical protein
MNSTTRSRPLFAAVVATVLMAATFAWPRTARAEEPTGAPATTVGSSRAWPALAYDGSYFVMKEFTLRKVAPHIEVWVGADLPVESADCRSANPADLVITDRQLGDLVRAFESVIRPTEARQFGVLHPRDGTHAQPELIDPTVPADAFRGDGNRTVVLIDNVRAGGWVVSQLIDATDRNVLTVRAGGWPNMAGAAPASFGPDACRTFNGYATPNYMEATLAHEYNHLTRWNRAGSFAPTWVSEGVANWASVATGFRDPSQDSLPNFSVACFLGHQASAFPPGWSDPDGTWIGGAENSLSTFGEPGQGRDCEYGPPETMVLYLAARYGNAFVKDLLFSDGASGITDGLIPTLAKYRGARTAAQTLQDWSTSLALDAVLDDGAELAGLPPGRFQVPALHASVNLSTPLAYASPGAPPNGADFVRLRNAAGAPINSAGVRGLKFEAPTTYAPRAVEWTVEADGHGPGDAALFSGSGKNFDRSIVRAVEVGAANPVVSFDTRFATEAEYDYGFVQVSTDGGKTFHSRPTAATTSVAASDAEPAITAQLPGFNGDSGGWIHQTLDLSDLRGKTVLVAFRYMSDGFVNEPGYWIDNVASGATLVSDGSTLTGWQTIDAFQPPTRVAEVSVRLVAFTNDHEQARVIDVPLDAQNRGRLSDDQLTTLRAMRAQTVLAIVNHYEPTEKLRSPARYQLTVNGTIQPGG